VEVIGILCDSKSGASPGKTSGVDSMDGLWGGVSPPKLAGRVWGYNLKLISTLHNDSIPETSSEIKWGGRVHPSPPVATPL